MTTTAVVKAKTRHIDELHFEHQLWISQAKFYADELKIYQKKLGEISTKNTAEDIRKQIEHFQNQFIIQKEQLDILTHQVNEHEQWLAKYAKEHPVAVDHELFADHKEMHEKMDRFVNIYDELKADFKKFLASTL
jgi:ribosomal protein S15P/S13E